MPSPIYIHSPESDAERLILLFHGVGSTPQHMVPLGRRLAVDFPQAEIISVPSAHASDFGSGLQWFSIRGVNEANRPGRIQEAIPAFIKAITTLQHSEGFTAKQTTLIGFSQGAIMALESTLTSEQLAGSVVAVAGRFAQLPTKAPRETKLHFVHGLNDTVVPFNEAEPGIRELRAFGAHMTMDLIPHLGHNIDIRAAACIIERLKTDFESDKGIKE